MSVAHDIFENQFKSTILFRTSVCESYIESIISIILSQNPEKMSELKLLLFDQSILTFEYKIRVFEILMKKYYKELLNEKLLKDLRDIRKLRNKAAHFLIADAEEAKRDEVNKRIRLKDIEGITTKNVFYTYDECNKFVARFTKTIDLLDKIVSKIIENEWRSNIKSKSENS